jgi:hypothetical protein
MPYCARLPSHFCKNWPRLIVFPIFSMYSGYIQSIQSKLNPGFLTILFSKIISFLTILEYISEVNMTSISIYPVSCFKKRNGQTVEYIPYDIFMASIGSYIVLRYESTCWASPIVMKSWVWELHDNSIKKIHWNIKILNRLEALFVSHTTNAILDKQNAYLRWEC